MTSQRLPALFLGHGSPMTVISDVPERRAWQRLGQVLPRPKAILAVSAHWETRGRTHVSSGAFPRTIHDFRGFPPELFAMQYPAPGSDWLAGRVEQLAGPNRIERDESWGFDHGVWGVLQPMFPQADIPVVAMSLDRSLAPDDQLALGAKLAPLREEGVLLVASGNIIHNLAMWRQSEGTQPEWALDFRARTNEAILADNREALYKFASDDRPAALAINSAEHYLPLLYTISARLPGDEVGLFNDTLDGALSMTSVMIGNTDILSALH